MSRIDHLRETAKDSHVRIGDQVALAGPGGLAGKIFEGGSYGYFGIRLDGSRRQVIRHFTDLVKIERTDAERAVNLRVSTLIMRGLDASEAKAQAARELGA